MADLTSKDDNFMDVGAPMYPSSVVSNPLDLSKLNPAGIGSNPEVTEKYMQALQAQNKVADDLENRYKDINLAKIAAALAKPQMGGLVAGLGNAFGALGQQVEAQRAIAPTISRMRAETAAQLIPLQQGKIASDTIEKVKSGQYVDPKDVTRAELYASGPTGALQKGITAGSNQLANVINGINAGMTYAEMAKGFPDVSMLDGLIRQSGLNVPGMPDKLKSNIGGSGQYGIAPNSPSLDASRPSQIDPDTWNGMSLSKKMEAITTYGGNQAAMGLKQEEGMRQSANSAMTRLPLLLELRNDAQGVGLPDQHVDGKTITGQQQMEKMFGYFQGGNPIDVVGLAADQGKFGTWLQGSKEYARKLGMSDAVVDRFQELAKKLADNQVREQIRTAVQTPDVSTDQFRTLQSLTQPGFDNTQRSLINLVDSMALAEHHEYQKYDYVHKNKVPYGNYESSLAPLVGQYAALRSRVATTSPDLTKPAPWWYDPTAQGPKQAAPANAPAAPAAAPAKGANAGVTPPVATTNRSGAIGDLVRQKDPKTGREFWGPKS